MLTEIDSEILYTFKHIYNPGFIMLLLIILKYKPLHGDSGSDSWII